MKYLLIDTCSWINLLSSESKNILLTQLVLWQKSKEVLIVTHEIVIAEWDKHKERKRKEFQDSLNMKYKHANEILKKENLPNFESLKPNIDAINLQIETIDTILKAESIVLTTSDKVKAYVPDRAITPKKAPFHNKVDSIKDAYIIFSALEYFKTENLNELIFISANKNEFGAVDDLERKIHPQIIEDYNEINVDYYEDIGRCIHDLKKTLTSLNEKDHSQTGVIPEEFEIDKSDSILNQVHLYLQNRYENLNFIPVHLLTRNYPFKKDERFVPYHNYFTLTTDNDDLFNLVESVEFDKNGEVKLVENSIYINTQESVDKIKYIFKKLTHNLIFNIESKSLHKVKSVFYRNEFICECLPCKYYRFHFAEVFSALKNEVSSLDELFQSAYIHYQIGNFIFAFEVYKKILPIAKKNNKETAYFIALYSLSKLSNFIRNHYYGENDETEKTVELNKINLDEQLKQILKNKNKKVLEWLKSNSFYSESRDKIHSIVEKIRDHYYSQLNGGWSSNSHIWELMSEFAQIDSFLNSNFIIYDRFSEFSDLFEVFTEGLIASHAMNELQQSRLKHFDDYLITKLVFYGKSDSILKYVVRYDLKRIDYKPTSKEGDTLLELIDNFFLGYQSTKESFEINCEKNNRYFWDRYNSIFSNLLVISGLINFKVDTINDLAKKLLQLLKHESSLHLQKIKRITYFLSRHAKNIDKNIIYEFLDLAIENGKYHDEGMFETLANILSITGSIELDDQKISLLISVFSEKCPICKYPHSPIPLVHFYKAVNAINKEKISSVIHSILSSKYNNELYYMAAIFEVVGVDGQFFDNFIEACTPSPDQKSFKEAFWGEKENRHSRIDMLINLAYKYNLDLSESRFDVFRKVSPYYDWLFNLTNFNYENFETKWIAEYGTKYYLNKFKTIPKIREELAKYIKENPKVKLEPEYIDILLV